MKKTYPIYGIALEVEPGSVDKKLAGPVVLMKGLGNARLPAATIQSNEIPHLWKGWKSMVGPDGKADLTFDPEKDRWLAPSFVRRVYVLPTPIPANPLNAIGGFGFEPSTK